MEENKLETMGSPLNKYVKQTISDIEASLGEWEVKEPVILELSTIIKGNTSGGVDIRVVNLGTKVEAEQIQKVRLAIGPPDEAYIAEKNARIAKANSEASIAERKAKIIAGKLG